MPCMGYCFVLTAPLTACSSGSSSLSSLVSGLSMPMPATSTLPATYDAFDDGLIGGFGGAPYNPGAAPAQAPGADGDAADLAHQSIGKSMT